MKYGNKENKHSLQTDAFNVEESPHIIKLKTEHLEQLIFNIKIFAERGDLQQLKKYLKTNYQKFSDLQNEIEKEEYSLKQLQITDKCVGNNDQNNGQELENKRLEQNLTVLQEEEKQLLTQIQQKKDQLQQYMFYREYQYMLQEKQGLIAQNQQLLQQKK